MRALSSLELLLLAIALSLPGAAHVLAVPG